MASRESFEVKHKDLLQKHCFGRKAQFLDETHNQRVSIMLITLSGPSGAGKTTISKYLSGCVDACEVPSYTTRPRRKSESGTYYRFLSTQEYALSAQHGDFILEDEVANAKYGTRKEDLDAAMNDERLWIADFTCTSVIDCIRGGYLPSLSLFLYVSKALCQERMLQRGDDNNKIQIRLGVFEAELEAAVRLATMTHHLVFIDAAQALSAVERRVVDVVNLLKMRRLAH